MMLNQGDQLILVALMIGGSATHEPSQKLENKSEPTAMLLNRQERLGCEKIADG
jgi:hypothetical protein